MRADSFAYIEKTLLRCYTRLESRDWPKRSDLMEEVLTALELVKLARESLPACRRCTIDLAVSEDCLCGMCRLMVAEAARAKPAAAEKSAAAIADLLVSASGIDNP